MVTIDERAYAGARTASGQTNITQHAAACFIMGFEGTTVTPHIRSLIANNGLGAILVTEKNIVDAAQLTQLIKDLQVIALEAGHPHPLLIAIDQENGPVNSIRDSQYIRQFPSAMAISSCNQPGLSYDVAKATADELACVGVNWILGPVLDVLSDVRTQPLGIRSAGHDPHEVAKLGQEYVRGYRAGGLATSGKHFPSYGSLSFHGSTLEMPIVSETLEELRRGAFVPIKSAIESGLDAMLVGACKMLDVDGTDIQHACLSEQVVTDILRHELRFDGLIMSECLEVESLFETLGVDQAVVMAFQAGCNMSMICNSMDAQLEAISGFRLGVESGILTADHLRQSLAKIEELKTKVTSWEKAISPGGTLGLERLSHQHRMLSQKSYEASVSLIRDHEASVPFPTGPKSHGTLLLLTPLVEPFDQIHAQTPQDGDCRHNQIVAGTPSVPSGTEYLPGEDTFRSLGLKLSRSWVGKVSHCTYTATGLRPMHEQLIASADKVIVVTADSVRNASQYGFTKCVAALCNSSSKSDGSFKTPCITVAMGSPYDFLHDESISTYICTYDFTEAAGDALVKLLFDNRNVSSDGVSRQRKSAATGVNKSSGQKLLWLAQPFDKSRDMVALNALLERVYPASGSPSRRSYMEHEMLPKTLRSSDGWLEARSFIVRNSSTGDTYGFCGTSFVTSLERGIIDILLVDPAHQRRGIGRSLIARAVRYLLNESGPIKELQLDFGMPMQPDSSCDGQNLEMLQPLINEVTRESGLKLASTGFIQVLQLADLRNWVPSPTTANDLRANGLTFRRARDVDRNSLHEHIQQCCQGNNSTESLLSHPGYMLHLYDMAAKDEASCNILVAYASDKRIAASCLVYSSTSAIHRYVPTPNPSIAGMTGFMVDHSRRHLGAIEGLAMISVNYLKKMAMQSVNLVLDYDFETSTFLTGMGFMQIQNQPVHVYDVR